MLAMHWRATKTIEIRVLMSGIDGGLPFGPASPGDIQLAVAGYPIGGAGFPSLFIRGGYVLSKANLVYCNGLVGADVP